jgi:hypothetical protein
MEKEYLRQSSSEVESLHATIKTTQEHLKQVAWSNRLPLIFIFQVIREKDKLFHVLETRDQEIETLQGVIHVLKEQNPSDPSISDRSLSTITRASAVKTPKISRNIHVKPFSSPGVSPPNKGRRSTGGIHTPGPLLSEEVPRTRVSLESICKPTFCSIRHHSSIEESTEEPESAVSPPSPPPVGSYRQGTMKSMANSRSRDAMMKHQVTICVSSCSL